MARLMEFIEQWGANIIAKFEEKPWLMYLILTLIAITIMLTALKVAIEFKEK